MTFQVYKRSDLLFHMACGEDVEVESLLHLVRTIVDFNGQPESAIKLVKIVDTVVLMEVPLGDP
jgi:hypothetical protein